MDPETDLCTWLCKYKLGLKETAGGKVQSIFLNVKKKDILEFSFNLLINWSVAQNNK